MLLATGVVLLMSLLSMAIFGVKVAGLTMPHDTASDGVLVTSTEVVSAVPELTEARTQQWINGGMEPLESAKLPSKVSTTTYFITESYEELR